MTWLAVAGWIVAFCVMEALRAWQAHRRLTRVLVLVLSGRPHSTYELMTVLGGGVYSALRTLEDRGVVRRYEDRGSQGARAFGSRPRVFYELV
jgi:DNA-binding PadR family transcriptional regulator